MRRLTLLFCSAFLLSPAFASAQNGRYVDDSIQVTRVDATVAAPVLGGTRHRHPDESLEGARRFLRTLLQSDHEVDTFSLRYFEHASAEGSILSRDGEGGYYIGACRRAATRARPYMCRPLLYRVDASGRELWRADLGGRRAFTTHEIVGVVTLPSGGAVVQVSSYRNPSINGVPRFLRIDDAGRRQWVVELPGTGTTDSPYPQRMRVDTAENVLIEGYYVPSDSLEDGDDWVGRMHRWSGRITATGQFRDAYLSPHPDAPGRRVVPRMSAALDEFESPQMRERHAREARGEPQPEERPDLGSFFE